MDDSLFEKLIISFSGLSVKLGNQIVGDSVVHDNDDWKQEFFIQLFTATEHWCQTRNVELSEELIEDEEFRVYMKDVLYNRKRKIGNEITKKHDSWNIQNKGYDINDLQVTEDDNELPTRHDLLNDIPWTEEERKMCQILLDDSGMYKKQSQNLNMSKLAREMGISLDLTKTIYSTFTSKLEGYLND